MQKQHLQLASADRAFLQKLVTGHNVPVKVYRRAQGLLALDTGQTLQSVAQTLGVNYNSVATWRDRYKQQGLDCLQDAPRSGRPSQITGEQRAKVTALACSTPPEGHARWTMTLLADKAVELELVPAISRARVAVILKKTRCART